MARKNERERGAGSNRGGGARKTAARRGAKKAAGAGGGARKAAGGRKAAGAKKASGARKSAARKTAGRGGGAGARKTGARKSATARKSAQSRGTARGRAATGTRGAASKAARRVGGAPRRPGGRGRGAAQGSYSDSTRRARWIESVDQHAERPGQTLATRDHEVIKRWAEERGAVPATISGTEHDGRPGVLRFDFPGGSGGGRLRQVDWDEWFQTFDDRKLVFLFQEEMKSGRQSNFFRLDNPEREEG